MKAAVNMLLASFAFVVACTAQAGTINDNYIGQDANNSSAGDIIGAASVYDIASATITRAASTLSITINTNFAGKANSSTYGSTGIGYGDIFLSNVWTPNANTSLENGTGTKWVYGISLDNSLANGGTYTLYKLGTTSAQTASGTTAGAIKTTDQVISCTNCDYRNGQIDQVNTKFAGNTNTGITGTWAVNSTAANTVTLQLNLTGTDMVNWNNFAMHWGETCQNDAIEGITSVVPTPGSLPLMALGLVSLTLMRRRRPS